MGCIVHENAEPSKEFQFSFVRILNVKVKCLVRIGEIFTIQSVARDLAWSGNGRESAGVNQDLTYEDRLGQDVSVYRPVAVFYTIAKVFEALFYK